MLATAIRLYRKSRAISTAVHLGMRVHHAAVKPETQPCPFAEDGPGACSGAGLAQARLLGIAALPLIWSRMSVCGPSTSDYCESFDPKSRIGEPFCDKIIRASDPNHYRNSC